MRSIEALRDEAAALKRRTDEFCARVERADETDELMGSLSLFSEEAVRLRASLEAIEVPEWDGGDASTPTAAMVEQLDDTVDAALAQLDDVIAAYELYGAQPKRSLPDSLSEAAVSAASRPVGEELLERIRQWAEQNTPVREQWAADDAIIGFDERDYAHVPGFGDLAARASELSWDALVHDWRWEEGLGVLQRFAASHPALADEQRQALRALEHSHFDLYRVEDVDVDRDMLHLERASDRAPVDVETDEELAAILRPGDGLIARIYPWADGPELGAFIPVDSDMMPMVERWLAELVEDGLDLPHLEGRSALLKAGASQLVSDWLAALANSMKDQLTAPGVDAAGDDFDEDDGDFDDDVEDGGYAGEGDERDEAVDEEDESDIAEILDDDYGHDLDSDQLDEDEDDEDEEDGEEDEEDEDEEDEDETSR